MRSAVLLAAAVAAVAFYLPGVAPRDFAANEEIELKVTNLDSTKTQLAYDYYTLPFCKPDDIVEASENLGEVMSGERIANTPYKLYMNKIESCKELCTKDLSKDESKMFMDFINDGYSVNWMVDNIPAATIYNVITESESDVQTELTAEKGFSMGFIINDKAYLHNHVRIVLSYHSEDTSEAHRIVGFEVIPFSVDYNNPSVQCNPLQPIDSSAKPIVMTGAATKVKFTYDIMWKWSPVKWASRWDVYLKSVNSEVHWFSIMNSITFVIVIAAMMGTILLRALKADLTRYNALDEMTEEDQLQREEEMGWKQVHADVFRTPAAAGWLAVFAGTGVQIITMTGWTIVFACAGLLSPANRGGLFTAFMALFVVMGIPAGFVASRLHKMFGLQDWKRNALRVAFFFPGVVFTIFFMLNLLVWHENSSNAIPFGTLVALLALWLGITLPLTLLGAYVGNRRPQIEPPVRVNHLARAIPLDIHFAFRSPYWCLLGGIVPFGAVFMEMFFIMTSVWEHQFYYMFGMLGIVFLLLIIVCAEASIFYTYYNLASENYHWWWPSFWASGSSAIYVFIYSIRYFLTLETTKTVTTMLFFGYMGLCCFAFALLTGTLGFLATLLFVRKIYATVKID